MSRLQRLDSIHAWIYETTDDDDGNFVEMEVKVWYRHERAEPDVGIPADYAEVAAVSTWVDPFGEIFFTPADHHMERLETHANEMLADL